MADRIRVMVVDDSAVVRGLLTRALESDPEIVVVRTVGDGKQAIAAAQREIFDVIVLDIEMPVMDGLTALPLLLEAAPTAKILMASTLTRRNAEISIRALSLGAADYVPKPVATREIHAGDEFRDELLAKTRALGAVAQRDPRRKGAAFAAERAPATPAVARRFSAERPNEVAAAGGQAAVSRRAEEQRPRNKEIVLRDMPSSFHPAIVGIGSSTGGPQALFKVLTSLRDAGLKVPLVITQHMPPTFTTILAEHITRQCGVPTTEAKDGEPLEAGHCYVAPGDYHMTVVMKGSTPIIRLNQNPPENFCRPSVEPMFRSLVNSFGRNVLAVVLTGMGQDGMKACRQIASAGGVIITQDELSSVVWGMPGAVTMDGSSNMVLPIDQVGPHIRKLAVRGAA